jgi:hypothetical protein
MKEQRQFLQHVQQLDLFSRFFSAPFRSTFNHRTNCFIQKKEAFELLFVRLLQE